AGSMGRSSLTSSTSSEDFSSLEAIPKSFHEKAGASQDVFVFTSVDSLPSSRAASVAILPSAVGDERFFARCKVGVLNSVRCCDLMALFRGLASAKFESGKLNFRLRSLCFFLPTVSKHRQCFTVAN